MVLTSTVAERVGHTTQICVMPGYQGHSIGRMLMENAIQALRRRNYESLSLTVTSINKRAVGLYEHLGFRAVKTFAAGVWQGVARAARTSPSEHHFFARSFSNVFSSSMNSFTSLKSR